MSGYLRRTALVTGGAGGIGAAIAARLAADGFRVVVLDIAEPTVPVDRFERIDLSDAGALAAQCARLAAEEEITCLVNNVGIVLPAALEQVAVADFDRLMHVNLRPSILCAQAFVPRMKALGGGRIVMNTSRVTLGKERRTLYSASKGAAQSMARTWALELGPHGITANAIGPGPIRTALFDRANPPDAPRTRAIIEAVPVRRIGTPDDVAHAASYLLDARSGFVTGQVLYVCGGMTVGVAGV